MRHIASHIAVYYCLLMLTSCLQPINTLPEKKATALCEHTCGIRFAACNKQCVNNCRRCAANVNYSAARKYRRYVHEHCVKGENVALELNSYRDPLQCRKLTCDCRADYLICMQSCGGVIYKQLRVPRPCC